jgi:glycerophosphoryl diester phosphodiesterase
LSSTCPEPGGSASHRTRIIAHRGASGYLPEHTAAAKTLAYGFGVDFLEQDVVACLDGTLVVLHDHFLNDVSNVAEHFPGRARSDGRFYVIDFSYSELAELRLHERRAAGTARLQFPGRYAYGSEHFRILRLEDELQLISGLNATTGHSVGVYTEIKLPAWHAEHGIDLARLVLKCLRDAGAAQSGPVLLQCFDAKALRRLGTELAADWPLIQLLDAGQAGMLESDPSRLDAIVGYAAGVGLPFECLLGRAADGTPRPSSLCERLLASELLIHPYTLRRDGPQPDGFTYFEVLDFLIRQLQVDALFCDQPDDALSVRDGSAA